MAEGKILCSGIFSQLETEDVASVTHMLPDGKGIEFSGYNQHFRPCFNIWESDGPWFDGSLSAKTALSEMKAYLEQKRKETIDLCKGCVAHNFCSECMMTQNRNKSRLHEYMKEACANNMRMFLENQKQ